MGKKSNPARKDKYSRQKQRTEENRLRKRQKHFRKHPNDAQTGALLP